MSDEARNNDPEKGRPEPDDEASLARRRAELDAQLARHRKPEGKVENDSARAGYAMAVKLSSEFIAGVAVGAILGYGFDELFGTSPWGMIVLLLVGFAAGVLNVMRSAGMIAKSKL